MIVIDASVWLSATLETDARHALTTIWSDWVRRSRIEMVVPAHFPAEVIGVMSRLGMPRSFLDRQWDRLAEDILFTIHPITESFGLQCARIAEHGAIRGSDALYVGLAQDLGLPLVTWDRQQRERGARFCRTLSPVEAVAAG